MTTNQSRSCKNSADIFCYICGEYMTDSQRKNITDEIKKAFSGYFGTHLGDQDKSWAPHKVCRSCSAILHSWSKGEHKYFKFGVPMIWRAPRNHDNDCYFSSVNIIGFNKKNKSNLVYPVMDSAIRPVIHGPDLPKPVCKVKSIEVEDNYSVDSFSNRSDSYVHTEHLPQKFTQEELNDLIRDLALSKAASEILSSRLAQKNLLKPEVSITMHRKRQITFEQYFSQDENLVFCNDIGGLILHFGITYSPIEWRLFIDSSHRSLKCVLLNNGNKYASLPIAHSTKLKENYESVKLILNRIKYEEHKWLICVDLKMVNFLLGQQGGYARNPCFKCLWNSRDKENHWKQREWPTRGIAELGKLNINHEPLVEKEKIILPPLHIKLGLMKQFVKSLNNDGDCFRYICNTFPKVSLAKLKGGIFDGPKIRQLMKDNLFAASMNDIESDAWISFVDVVHNFLGNRKAENYKDMVCNMLQRFEICGAKMSIKVHFLHSHLDSFPDNLGDYSEEQGERFHQDIWEINS